MRKASSWSLSLRAKRSNLKQSGELFCSLRRRLPRPFGPRNDVREGFQLGAMFIYLAMAFLPMSAGAQGQQWLRYQSSNNTLAAAQDTSAENPEPDSQQQVQDDAVSLTGLFFIVVVIVIGVLFAIVIVAGHGGRQAT